MRETSKRFIAVSVHELHVEPGEEVEWLAVDGQGPFDIVFDKAAVDPSPFPAGTVIETNGSPVTINPNAEAKSFAYSVYLQGDHQLCLDPSLIVEKP